MVDLRREMILARRSEANDFKDLTADIRAYEEFGDRVLVTFRSGRQYSYGRHRLLILAAATRVVPDDRVRIEVDDAIWTTVTEAYVFEGPDGPWWRIYYRTSREVRSVVRSPSRHHVRTVGNGAAHGRAAKILRYWRDLAARLPADSRSLKSAYKELDFVRADSVLGAYLEARPVEAANDDSPVIFPFRSNGSQRDAIRRALRHPISVVEGPPGTGKTQTILNLIANIVQDPTKTVAVVSSNNAAVDNVYEKLIREGLGYVVANLGRSEKQAEFFATRQPERNTEVDALVGTVIDRPERQRLIDIDRSLELLQKDERDLAACRIELDAYRLELVHFSRYLERQELPELADVPLLRRSSTTILDFMAETDLPREHGLVDRLIGRVKRYFKYGSTRGIGPIDSGLILNLQRAFYARRIAELEGRAEKLSRSLASHNIEELAREQCRLSSAWLHGALQDHYSERNRTTYRRGDQSRRAREFTADYPVVLSTCHSLQQSLGRGRMVDYLIIDESSQVDLLAAGLALANCRNLVVVGDLRQLPHIPDAGASADLCAPWAAYDYERHSVLSSIVELYGAEVPRTILREHYRCDPSIIGFCDQKFYDGQLIPFTERAQHGQPLIVVRTVEGNHMRQHRGGGRSNQREIEVIKREVIPTYCADIAEENVGVTTPYRRQVEKAGDALSSDIGTSTVHQFQGREMDAVVFSTVLDETWRGGTGLRFVDDPQLVNVSVSRARKRFVLVTNHDMLPKSRHLRDLIGYIRYQNPEEEPVESEIVSIFDLLYQEYSARLRPLAAKRRHKINPPSEDIAAAELERILADERYQDLTFVWQVRLKNLLPDERRLTPDQAAFVRNNSSVDFVVYNRITKRFGCAIEVDGFAFHENNPTQLARDERKDAIFEAYGMRLLRLPTTGQGEERRIRSVLEDVCNDGVEASGSGPVVSPL